MLNIVYIDGPAYLEEPLILNQPNTYYKLIGDLTASGDGIIIQADGITLDLDWHTISGPFIFDLFNWDYGVYASQEYSDIVVKNGRIEGFFVGTSILNGLAKNIY